MNQNQLIWYMRNIYIQNKNTVYKNRQSYTYSQEKDSKNGFIAEFIFI